jgi:hypothetical protein
MGTNREKAARPDGPGGFFATRRFRRNAVRAGSSNFMIMDCGLNNLIEYFVHTLLYISLIHHPSAHLLD